MMKGVLARRPPDEAGAPEPRNMESSRRPALFSSPPPAAAPEGPAAGQDLTGQSVGDFRVLRRLGEGGMGQVYLAEQISLKRPVALKILKAELAANPTSRQRFKAEAEAVARATHPNIVQVYAIGEHAGLAYMALEYVEGFTLRDYLLKKGPPPPALALSIMRQGAAALQRAAELGIVHRDIKPENLLLTRKGAVKVADFGLSRCLAPDERAAHLTQTGVTMGTPLYMSPEQVEAKPLDPRSDLYSFGVTCYHMLAGNPPFRGQSAFEVALHHVQTDPPPLSKIRPDLPPELCAVVHRLMAKQPDQRFQTARELLQELARLRDRLGEPSSPTVAVTTTPEDAAPAAAVGTPAHRARWLWGAAGLSVVVVLAVGAALGWRSRPPAVVSADAVERPPAEPGAEAIDATKPRELYLLSEIRQYVNRDGSALGASGPARVQALRQSLELGVLYFNQRRWDDAERFFTWLGEAPRARDFHGVGQLGRATALAFRDQSRESIELFQAVVADKDMPLTRLAVLVNRVPAFVQWVVKALDYDAENVAATGKPFPPELQALRRAGPLPVKPPGGPVRSSSWLPAGPGDAIPGGRGSVATSYRRGHSTGAKAQALVDRTAPSR
jgi:serine/threonine-protein kinase